MAQLQEIDSGTREAKAAQKSFSAQEKKKPAPERRAKPLELFQKEQYENKTEPNL
jgi:hypothetical protein